MSLIQDLMNEEVKGWKHAGRDLAAARQAKSDDAKEITLIRLKKSGDESKMHDAVKKFKSEKEAREHHDLMVKNNPGHTIKHNMYIGGKVQVLEAWNPLEDERREQRTMDNEKRSFKRQELEQELGHEVDDKNHSFARVKYGIEIDGVLWKRDGEPVEFFTRGAADKAAATLWKRGKATKVKRLAEGFVQDAVKGLKRKLNGKLEPEEVLHQYVRTARAKIKFETPEQAERAIAKARRVSKVVNKVKEGVDTPDPRRDDRIQAGLKAIRDAGFKARIEMLKPIGRSVHFKYIIPHHMTADEVAKILKPIWTDGYHLAAEADRTVVKIVAETPSLKNEAVAEPFKKFKKGQIVTVKKTGEKVEVMRQDDIGLVFTKSEDAVKIPNDKNLKMVPGRGYKEYMPKELQEERLVELSPETIQSYRAKRLAQHTDHSKPHPKEKPYPADKVGRDGLTGNGPVKAGLLASYRRQQREKARKSKKDNSIQGQYYSGEPGSYTGD